MQDSSFKNKRFPFYSEISFYLICFGSFYLRTIGVDGGGKRQPKSVQIKKKNYLKKKKKIKNKNACEKCKKCVITKKPKIFFRTLQIFFSIREFRKVFILLEFVRVILATVFLFFFYFYVTRWS